MSHVRCARRRRRPGRSPARSTPGRHARLGQTGEEAASPGGSVVRRHGEADVRRRALEAASDLEGGNRRSAEREAVGLDLGLVLGAVVPVRVARESATDELAIARDASTRSAFTTSSAGAAAHRVAASVVCREHQVGSGPAVHRVAAAAAVEVVGPACDRAARRVPRGRGSTSLRGVPTSRSFPAVPVIDARAGGRGEREHGELRRG